MLALIVILAMPHFASAATFTVNSTADTIDARPGDGFCETEVGNGVCTLRAAIMETNMNLPGPVPDTIILPRGLYRLTIPDTSVVDNIGATGDLDIVQSLNIVGAGSGVTVIDGNLCPANDQDCTPQNTNRNVSRVFHIVRPGVTPTVQISGVTIQNAGRLDRGLFAQGGAIAIGVGARLVLRDTIITKSKAGLNQAGGGIHNAGNLFIFDSIISDNVAEFGGGGIANSGRLFISASKIDGNTSTSFGGGGIRNFAGATVRIEESTVSHNMQTGGGTGGGASSTEAV
jgi:CSLREA domain-containing protein